MAFKNYIFQKFIFSSVNLCLICLFIIFYFCLYKLGRSSNTLHYLKVNSAEAKLNNERGVASNADCTVPQLAKLLNTKPDDNTQQTKVNFSSWIYKKTLCNFMYIIVNCSTKACWSKQNSRIVKWNVHQFAKVCACDFRVSTNNKPPADEMI